MVLRTTVMKKVGVLFFLLFLAVFTTFAYSFFHADKVALKRAARAYEKGDYREAVLQYRETLARGALTSPQLLNLAEAHLMLGETDNAEGIYERLLREGAGDAGARERLILLNVRKGRFDRAAELYRQHLLGKPRDRAAWIGMARVLAYAGRFDESAAAYRKALGDRI